MKLNTPTMNDWFNRKTKKKKREKLNVLLNRVQVRSVAYKKSEQVKSISFCLISLKQKKNDLQHCQIDAECYH